MNNYSENTFRQLFRRNYKGFTLLELLLVIAGIVILAALLIFTLNPLQIFQELRDSERTSDMRDYYQTTLTNPEGLMNKLTTDFQEICDENGLSRTGDSDNCIDVKDQLVPDYMRELPRDPSLGENDTGTGYYARLNQEDENPEFIALGESKDFVDVNLRSDIQPYYWEEDDEIDVPFIFTVNTAINDPNDADFEMPINYDDEYKVDWGDGTVEYGLQNLITHTYDDPGEYTIKISGGFQGFNRFDEDDFINSNNANEEKIMTIEQWGDAQWTNASNAFQGAVNMTGEFDDTPDLSQTESANSMFSQALNFDSDIGDWDTSSVADMREMFFYATAFNSDIGDWDVGNVTNMRRMFMGADNFNQDISNWDVSKVTNMYMMFNFAESFNQDIGDWDVSSVTNMFVMFKDAENFNQDIGDWDVRNVTDMQSMFKDAENFNQDIGDWDVRSVTNMRRMFMGAENFNQDIGDWDVRNVTGMQSMFQGADNFNNGGSDSIKEWDVSSVWDMARMFEDAENFNQDLSGWDVSSVGFCPGFDSGATNWEDDHKPNFTNCTP